MLTRISGYFFNILEDEKPFEDFEIDKQTRFKTLQASNTFIIKNLLLRGVDAPDTYLWVYNYENILVSLLLSKQDIREGFEKSVKEMSRVIEELSKDSSVRRENSVMRFDLSSLSFEGHKFFAELFKLSVWQQSEIVHSLSKFIQGNLSGQYTLFLIDENKKCLIDIFYESFVLALLKKTKNNFLTSYRNLKSELDSLELLL